MSSNNNFNSNLLFQSITDDLNASLATADELSREFSSLMQDISSNSNGSSTAQSSSSKPQDNISSIQTGTNTSSVSTASIRDAGGSGKNRGTMSFPQTTPPIRVSEPSIHSSDSFFTTREKPSPNSQVYQYTSTQPRNTRTEPVYSHGTLTPPNQSPHTPRRLSPNPTRSHERNLSGSFNFSELTPTFKYEQPSVPSMLQVLTNPVASIDSPTSGRRSPRLDRVPSPGPFSQPMASTLPRSFTPFKTTDDGVQRQSGSGKWNETDLDVSYERKPHHTYDKNDWIRPSFTSSNWRESNLDSPAVPRKDTLPRHLPSADGSLPRNTRISVPPDRAPPNQSPFNPQPIISRVSIPPASSGLRAHKPIPLSVIMRLQNPYYTAATRYPYDAEGERDLSMQRQPAPLPLPRDLLYHFQPIQEQRSPVYYPEAPKPGYVDLVKINSVNKPSVPPETQAPSVEPKVEENTDDSEMESTSRPPSPAILQRVVAPEAPVVPDMDMLLQIRAEIPRALKKRGSVDHSLSLKKKSVIQPNQYKQMIKKMFHRNRPQTKSETGSESSSSDGEENTTSIPYSPSPVPNTAMLPQQKGLQSILRKPKGSSGKGQRARLSPLVLLLDGSLVGELDTVQRAVQEMSDPSQPNDEGITALHNAICGGHYAVVEFLVSIGANVSAPDSHGWTPLHCAASCNDRSLCEFLVHSGAAVMAVTESDGATAAQKCDPYAVGYEECESFLRGVEEAMGVEKSGVVYALWSYPAQTHDELSFKEGDMVTILQKPEGMDWWWASLYGREGLVPNNYFGLFPKVRPKSLC
ncbi:relA-associated inhibitor [Tachysurus fulvidraco]|uniref:relA-associated inhibitor n=1 Tax=Tachysurus fulvidraco TaxID=1234273 RepID=UPI001FED5CB6|nr:relA-associated inhibitor [Tachysurus fulvidraco]